MLNTQSLAMMHNLPPQQLIDVEVMQARLESWCNENNLDALLITAQDAFLSEYAPLNANHRFQLSAFTGSTGDGIFLCRALADKLHQQGRFQLFVDGRYHLQADQETHPTAVAVHKFGLATGMDEAMFSWMRANLHNGLRLGVDLQRVGWSRWKALQELGQKQGLQLRGFGAGEIAHALNVDGWKIERPIKQLGSEITGRTPQGNLAELRLQIGKKLSTMNFVYATCMGDDVAWLLSARAYHLPQLSSMLAYTFFTEKECIVHLPEESQACAISLPENSGITVTRGALQNALQALKNSLSDIASIEQIAFSGRAMNAALPQVLFDLFSGAKIRDDVHCLEELRAAKTPQELNAIRHSFLRSSRAIAKTLRWAKECEKTAQKLSETDLAARIKSEYGNEGALELSFKTISGFAENGAVIHYSNPNPQKLAQLGDLLLLDSGAYYKEGFATDCTRVVVFANDAKVAQQWQKEIYTLTLKACLAGLRATFNLKTPCKEIDALARTPLKDKGYDYAHGTGHGIGIHVHESGIRLSPVSHYTFTEHAVVSVEPGIYLAGKGGVRIENVAIIVPRESSPQNQHTHAFENVVFVGYDWDLIDLNLLSSEDKNDLADYERKCQSLGTAVTECPLL
ncbi:M24 family metallopeptidase [bacterium]|nr:M24 family metallopeptidase [bacterium]